MNISMEHKDIKGVLVWISQRIVVLPLSLFLYLFFLFFLFFCIFLWPQWLFLFNSHLSSLGSFNVSTLGSFPHLRATLYFYKKVKEIFHTLQGTQNHKEDVTIMMYAMYAAASVEGTCMTRRSCHEEVDVAWQYISKRLWKCLDR